MTKLTPKQKLDRTYTLVLEYGTNPAFPQETKEQIRLLELYGYSASKNGTPLEQLKTRQLRGFAQRVFKDTYKFWNTLSEDQKKETQKRYEHSQEVLRELEIQKIKSRLHNPNNIFLASRILNRFKETPKGLYEKKDLIKLYNSSLENGLYAQRLTSNQLSFYSYHIYRQAQEIIQSLSIQERKVLGETQKLEEKIKESCRTKDHATLEDLAERIAIMLEANNIPESSLAAKEADRILRLKENIATSFVKRQEPKLQKEQIPF